MSVDLSNFGKKPSKPKKGERPTVKLPSVALKVDRYSQLYAEKKKLENELEPLNKELRGVAFKEFLAHNANNQYVSSVDLIGVTSKITATFTSGYRSLYDREDIEPIIGGDKTDEMFSNKFILTIDGGQIPEHLHQLFVKRLVSLCDELEIEASEVIKADHRLVPNKNFNELKVKLPMGVNLDLDKVVPTPSTLKPAAIAPGSGVVLPPDNPPDTMTDTSPSV